MSAKDAKKTFNAQGGAIKFADLDAAYPTGPAYSFDPKVWKDLGAIKKQPTLTSNISSNTVTLWNISDITLGSNEAWSLNFGSGQFDWENFKLFFNFDEIGTDGGFTPGDINWEGQLAVMIRSARGLSLLHAPFATFTGKGDVDFLKTDLTELNSTFALNPADRLDGGKPWKFFPGFAVTEADPE